MDGERILIVDDDPEIAEIIREIAEPLGFEVEYLQLADTFIKTVKSFKPDIIMLDIVMPDVDGIELLKKLAKTDTRPRILLMSGYNESYMRNAKKIGNASGIAHIDCLEKPILPADLRKILTN